MDYPITTTYMDGLLRIDEDFGTTEVDPKIVALFVDMDDSTLAKYAKEFARRGNVRDPRIRDAPLDDFSKFIIDYREANDGGSGFVVTLKARILDRFIEENT